MLAERGNFSLEPHWFRILPGPTLEPATLGLATCGEFVGEDLVCSVGSGMLRYLRFDAQGPTVLLEHEWTVDDPWQFDAGFGRVCYWGGELGGQEQELSFVDVETGKVTGFVIPDDPDGLFERPLACGETRVFLHKIFTTTLRERDYAGTLIREHEIELVWDYPEFFARGIGERFWVWREGPTATFSSGASVGAIVWALDRATGLQFRLPSSPYIPFEVITWGDYIAWTMVVGDQGIVRLVRVAP